jgi:hypothetical protein
MDEAELFRYIEKVLGKTLKNHRHHPGFQKFIVNLNPGSMFMKKSIPISQFIF